MRFIHRSRPGKLLLAALTVALVCILLSPSTLTPTRAGRQASSSRVYAQSGWSATLSADEAAYCLAPYYPNVTWDVSPTQSLVLTNATGLYSGSCSSAPQHWGLAMQFFNGTSQIGVLLIILNNTTTAVPGSITTYSYLVTIVPVTSFQGTTTIKYDWGYHVANRSTSMKFLGCGGDILCGGSGSGTSWASLTVVSSTSSCPTGTSGSFTVYVWDNVCFGKGFPYNYPHPDMNFYQLYSTLNYVIQGSQLVHIQMGTNWINSLGGVGPYAIGAMIGAAIGALGGPLAAAIGALAGVIISAVALWVSSSYWYDESGAIWIWASYALYNLPQTVPLWVILLGPTAVLLWFATHYQSTVGYLRVGSHTYTNYLGLSGP